MLKGEERESLRESLLGCGFDVARFTDLSPLSDVRLKEWVDRGYHADMEWLRNSIEKRLDPNLVLEGSSSAIMLGVNYLPSDEGARSQNRWAKYAIHEDYHDTILKGLKMVGTILEDRFKLARSDYRYYVDTGPVMERGWAAAAGLGWQGKNGMLISRQHGNWLLLGAILIRLEIEPDAPVKKLERGAPELGALCGKCVRCMDICPTSAIREPGLVDANRCISYQTIENKGIIPRDLRAMIGTRIFGCDICLDICPWNRFASSGRQLLLSTRYEVTDLDLVRILNMDIEEFREVFRKMPIKRLKLRGLLRNACIVAGNLREHAEWREGEGEFGETGDDWFTALREGLIRLAVYEEAMVRPHAVWALYRLLGDEARIALAAARLREADAATLEEYAFWESR